MTKGLSTEALAQLARLEPAVREAFLKAVSQITSSVQLRVLEEAIKDRQWERVIQILQLDGSVWTRVDRAITEAHFEGGVLAIASLPQLSTPFGASRLVLGFNGRHPRAEEWAKVEAANLIREITEDQKEMVRLVLREGLEQNRGVRQIALDLIGRTNKTTGLREGGFIGLTKAQAQYVLNAQSNLVYGGPEGLRTYLTRARRDARFDKTVKAALRDKRPLTKAEVDKITGRYRDRLLQLRAETIARTETLTAFTEGQVEGYRQLLDTGAVRPDQIERTWSATPDKFTREHHLLLNGQVKKGLDEPFQAADGSLLRFPRDRSLGASGKETINCRCYLQIRVKSDGWAVRS